MKIVIVAGRAGRLAYRLSRESKVYDHRWLPMGFPLSDPRKARITFAHIFRHTSGLAPQASTVEEALPVEQGRNQWDNYVAWVIGHDPVSPGR